MIRITESMESPKRWLSIEVTFGNNDDNVTSLRRSGRSIMEVPRFPAPPPVHSISLDISEPPISTIPTTATVTTTTTSNQRSGCSELLAAARRRARSASWLVSRKQQQHVATTSSSSSSRRRVRPIVASSNGRRQLAAELGLSMKRNQLPSQIDADEKDDEDEDGEDEKVNTERGMMLERIREEYTPKKIKENRVDETDVICYATAEVNDKKQLGANPIVRASITQRLSPLPPPPLENEPRILPAIRRKGSGLKSTSMQTQHQVLYRLRIFPTLKDVAHEGKETNFICRCFRFLGRLVLCQFGLTWLLTIWAILGASAFYVTEGPRERHQVGELKTMQRDLAVNLATELRQLRVDDKEIEPLWSLKIRQYVARHEKLLLKAVSSGYGEGGESGQLWTFPGCVLFAISVLTTLGFGAPVPRTSAGRTVTVLFAFIGIPAHFLLVLNIGLMLAVRLKKYGILRSYREECLNDPLVMDYMPMPMWVKVTPFLGIAAYYTLGIISFGFARLQPISDSLMFPLDFTAAGGLSTINGHVRVLYGIYLEGAVTLAAFAVAVLKVSATQSLTNIGLKYGLLIPA